MGRRQRRRGRGAKVSKFSPSSQHFVDFKHGSISSQATANFPRSSFNLPAGRGFRIAAVEFSFVGYSTVSSTAWCVSPSIVIVKMNSPVGVEVANSGSVMIGAIPKRVILRAPPSTDYYGGNTGSTVVLISVTVPCFASSVTPAVAFTMRTSFQLQGEDETATCPTSFVEFGSTPPLATSWGCTLSGTVGDSSVSLDGSIGPVTSIDFPTES